MRPRPHHPPVLLLLVLALLTSAALPAVLAGTDGSYVEPGKFRYYGAYTDQKFLDVSFHPEDGTALLVGGSGTTVGGQSPAGDRYVIRYDGEGWDLVLRDQNTRKGKILDVAWRPQGDYALLVGEKNSILRCDLPCVDADNMTELWSTDVTRLAGQEVHGRRVAWHPSGDFALVTGNALLRWNGSDFDVVDPGFEKLFSGVAWHPSGEFALVQLDLDAMLLCHAPCRNGTHLEELPFTYAKYRGDRAIEGFSFHPDGDRAYVYGFDSQHGTVLELGGVNRTDPANWTERYLEPAGSKPGEFTGMAWRPGGDTALLSSSLERQVLSLDPADDSFRTLYDRREPKMHDVAWDPTGTYALLPVAQGFIRYDPGGMPTVEIEAPEDRTVVNGTVNVTGWAHPREDGDAIERLEFRPGRFGAWRNVTDLNWTIHGNGSVRWTFAIDVTPRGPGAHLVAVRPADAMVVGAVDYVTLVVEDPRAEARNLTAPHLTVEDAGWIPSYDENGTVVGYTYRFTLTWSSVENATRYEVQSSLDSDFVHPSTVFEGEDTELSLQLGRNGTYHYRLRAVDATDPDHVVRSPWVHAEVHVSGPPPASDDPDAAGNDTDDPTDGDGDGDDPHLDPNGDDTGKPGGDGGDDTGASGFGIDRVVPGPGTWIVVAGALLAAAAAARRRR